MSRRSSSGEERGHPWFARCYAGMAWLGERAGVGERRERLLAGVRGRLVVVGVGPGYDLEHLPPGVREVVAVDPDPAMLRRTTERAARLRRRGLRVVLVAAEAERLPVPDGSADAVLCAFVLCSVRDPLAALGEARRVLRPGGSLLLLEHVHAPDGSRTARVQEELDRWWPRLAAGCRLSRETRAYVRAAGFDDSGVRDVVERPGLPVLAHLIEGEARAP